MVSDTTRRGLGGSLDEMFINLAAVYLSLVNVATAFASPLSHGLLSKLHFYPLYFDSNADKRPSYKQRNKGVCETLGRKTASLIFSRERVLLRVEHTVSDNSRGLPMRMVRVLMSLA